MRQYFWGGFVIFLIFLVFLVASKSRQAGINESELKCSKQEEVKNEAIIKYRNVYVKQNLKTRLVSINDKFVFLKTECTDCGK
jgi:Tfp pilus assembly protein PilO